MRTTLTLDADVARLIDDVVHESRRSRKDVVNDALRRALRPTRPELAPFRVDVHHSLRPGLDVARLDQLADELEDDAIARRIG